MSQEWRDALAFIKEHAHKSARFPEGQRAIQVSSAAVCSPLTLQASALSTSISTMSPNRLLVSASCIVASRISKRLPLRAALPGNQNANIGQMFDLSVVFGRKVRIESQLSAQRFANVN